jgi:transcriptional regulator NrdR family protein
MALIVKRAEHKEAFDERKIYASVYAACISAHWEEQKCEKIADDVTRKLKQSLGKIEEISSTNIREMIIKELEQRDQQLAFFYKQHLPNLKKL